MNWLHCSTNGTEVNSMDKPIQQERSRQRVLCLIHPIFCNFYGCGFSTLKNTPKLVTAICLHLHRWANMGHVETADILGLISNWLLVVFLPVDVCSIHSYLFILSKNGESTVLLLLRIRTTPRQQSPQQRRVHSLPPESLTLSHFHAAEHYAFYANTLTAGRRKCSESRSFKNDVWEATVSLTSICSSEQLAEALIAFWYNSLLSHSTLHPLETESLAFLLFPWMTERYSKKNCCTDSLGTYQRNMPNIKSYYQSEHIAILTVNRRLHVKATAPICDAVVAFILRMNCIESWCQPIRESHRNRCVRSFIVFKSEFIILISIIFHSFWLMSNIFSQTTAIVKSQRASKRNYSLTEILMNPTALIRCVFTYSRVACSLKFCFIFAARGFFASHFHSNISVHSSLEVLQQIFFKVKLCKSKPLFSQLKCRKELGCRNVSATN